HYQSCAQDPNFRCFDDWQCPGSGPTGYASSLFGPTSLIAQSCAVTGTDWVCLNGGTGCPAYQGVPAGCTCAFAGTSGTAGTCLSQMCQENWQNSTCTYHPTSS